MEPNDAAAKSEPRLVARLVWFAGLWLASVLALCVVAYAIRWALKA